ncbi:MAG: hypothetical protein ACRD0P_02805, partial [Stackebrandtia sp.]
PQLWLDGSLDRDWSVLPFSLGRANCAGAMLGGYLATATCAAILRRAYLRLAGPALTSDRRLPMALNPASVRFTIGVKPSLDERLSVAAGSQVEGGSD